MTVNIDNVDVELYQEQRMALYRTIRYLSGEDETALRDGDLELLEGLMELNDHIYDEMVPI